MSKKALRISGADGALRAARSSSERETSMNERDLFIEALQRSDPAGTLPLTVGPADAATPTTELASSADRPSTLPLTEGPGEAGPDATEFASSHDPQVTLEIANEPGDTPDATKQLSTEEQFDPGATNDWAGTAPLGAPDMTGLAQFELLAELGRGGMGVVYKARHRALHRIVALKMVLDGKHAPSEHRERFRLDVRIGAFGVALL